MTITPKQAPRTEILRDALPASIDMLHRRRAGDIAPGYIDEYVSLRWLEWHGGTLRTTALGESVCRQAIVRLLSLDTSA